MKKFLLLVSFLIPFILTAQISIVSTDMAVIGETISRQQDTLPSVTEGLAGANQTWLLNTAVIHVPLNTNVMAPSSTPYAADFPSSDLAMTNDNLTYIYFSIDANFFITDGVAGDLLLTGETLKAPFNPNLTLNEYSTDYGDNYVDTYGYDVKADGSTFNALLDSIWVKHTGTVYDTCDGWGITKTLVGEYNSLRVKRVEYSIDSIWSKLPDLGFPFPPPTWDFYDAIIDTTTTYAWLAKEGKLAIAELTFDSLNNPDVFTWTNVPAIPVANFSYTDNGSGGFSFTDLSINTPTTWLWDFGDGNTSTTQNPTNQYTSDATYNVCVTVTNASGSDNYCESVVVTGASVNPPPVANFSYTDNGAWQLTLTDLSANGPMTSWAWTFGDGSPTSTIQNPVHQYTTFGSFQICLTVDNGNGTDMFCDSATIADTTAPPQAPVASFTWSDIGNGQAAFIDASSNNPTSWSWDFGDGSPTSSAQNTTNLYANVDSTYNVCLTATNGVGSDTYCETVTVVGTVVPQAPVASFSWADNGNGLASFTDLSTNTPTGWYWDFGDTFDATTKNTTHIYLTMDATYNVCLTATNGVGSDTYCDSVTVMSTTIPQAPVALFSWKDNGNGIAAFMDLSTNVPTSWVWDFGDGNSVTTQNSSNMYQVMDVTYNVCLQATNGVGSDVYCDSVTVLSTTPIGIGDLEFSSGIHIYPNPADQYITISVDGLEGDYTVIIRTIIGQQVVISSVAGQNLHSHRIDFPSLQKGLHLLELRNDAGNLLGRQKLVIER